MSAFICNDYHISAMVNFWHEPGRTPHLYLGTGPDKQYKGFESPSGGYDGQDVGQTLKDENYRSVNARYRDEFGDAPLFEWDKIVIKDALQTIVACRCWQYQSCESDDYDETLGWAISENIIHHAIRKLPGWDDAEWGLTPPDNYKVPEVINVSEMFKRG